jgi:hypothetical protein
LPETVAHHVFVLRLQTGDTIQLFNGEGGCYVASIVDIAKKGRAELKVFLPEEVELPYSLTLAQALPEGSKMDWIIEKAMELGISSIQPLASQRCVVRLSAERAEKNSVTGKASSSPLPSNPVVIDLRIFRHRWIWENGWGNRIYINGSCFRRVPINRWPNGQNIAPTGGQLTDRS